MTLTLFSFGYKHGYPEADTILDVRFLPNPYYVPELSPRTGLEPEVARYVTENEVAGDFFTVAIPFLKFFIDSCRRAERPAPRIGVGCTGGRHRSVAVAEKLKSLLADHGYQVELFHRDVAKN